MKVKEYLAKIEIIKKEIDGCKNLQSFYKTKQESLEKELETMLNMNVNPMGIGYIKN